MSSASLSLSILFSHSPLASASFVSKYLHSSPKDLVSICPKVCLTSTFFIAKIYTTDQDLTSEISTDVDDDDPFMHSEAKQKLNKSYMSTTSRNYKA